MSDVHPATPLGSPALSPADDDIAWAAAKVLAENGQLRVTVDDLQQQLSDAHAELEAEQRHLDGIIAQRDGLAGDLADMLSARDLCATQRDQLQAAHNALSRKNAELAAELRELTGYHDELLEDVLRNAGDEWDLDEAADAIAVKYVRHLEAGRVGHLAALEAIATSDGTCGAKARKALEGSDFAIIERERTRLATQAQELESVIREMLAHWERIGTTREDDELIAGWAARAGIEVEG